MWNIFILSSESFCVVLKTEKCFDVLTNPCIYFIVNLKTHFDRAHIQENILMKFCAWHIRIVFKSICNGDLVPVVAAVRGRGSWEVGWMGRIPSLLGITQTASLAKMPSFNVF